MLILELMTSLLLWIMIMIPTNSYLLGINERSPYKIIQDISNQTIFDVTKISNETVMSRSDLCEGKKALSEIDDEGGDPYMYNDGSGSSSPISYSMASFNIPVKSTSSEATAIVSDGQNIFVSLNSASTTDYDLITYDYKNLSLPSDKIDSGPGIIGLTFVGRNLFAINSSVNSAIQRFKSDSILRKINKMGDYKIPWSSSYNPVYATKISSVYPYLFIGLKKNTDEELLSVDLNKLDLGPNLETTGAINKKWELDSSVQAIWPMYDKYLHLLISTAKEPEINDFCLNCDFAPYSNLSLDTPQSPLSTFDLFGSLGNVRSLIAKNGSIYVGRTVGNNELFKIDSIRDYSSTTAPQINYDLVNSIDVDDGIYSMLLATKNLFLVAGKTNSKIQIRNIDDLSKIIQTINSSTTISDLECIGDKIFGVGSNYKMSGTTTLSITPIIFELKPM